MATTPLLSLLRPFERPKQSQPAPRDFAEAQVDSVATAKGKREVEQILAIARDEAAQLIDDARVQAEAIREAAWQEGHSTGYQLGLQRGKEESVADYAALQDGLRTEIQSLVDQIGSAWVDLWNKQEQAMLGLVLDISRQVVKTEITQNREVILELVKNCLRRVTDKENVRIRLSFADSENVKALKNDLMMTIDGLRGLEIVEDRRINEGGCIIETNAGSIDARIPTQYGEIEKALNLAELD